MRASLTLSRKKALSSQTSELEALEARLKATEERLKQRQSMIGTSGRGSQSPRQRKPISDTFAAPPEGEVHRSPTSPLATELRPKTPTRPPTGKRSEPSYAVPPMPGALPPTPGASEGEFAVPEDMEERISADYVVINKDGDFPPPRPSKSSNRPSSDS
jgi:hypothetical protein